jgi:3'-5' exoribonuclease 1
MNYIIYDLEATCWDNSEPEEREPEIIEIGAWRVNEFGEVRGKFSRFVRPVLNPTLSNFCMQLTTIQQVDVNRANEFREVIEEFQDWARIFNEAYLLCSWGNFDRKMFIKDCKLHRLEYEWAEEHINLKDQYMTINRIQGNKMGLQRALLRENLPFTGTPHRAISDAENLTRIFLRYMGQWRL